MKSFLAVIARQLVLALAFVVAAPPVTWSAEKKEKKEKVERQRKEQDRQPQQQDRARQDQDRQRQQQERARQEQDRQRQQQERARQEQDRQRQQQQDRARQEQERQRQQQDRARQEQDRQRQQQQERARQEQDRQRQQQDRARQAQELQRQQQDRTRQEQDRARQAQEIQRQQQDRARQEQDRQRQDRDRQAQQQADERQRQELERRGQAQQSHGGNPDRARDVRDHRATPPARPAYTLPASRVVARPGKPARLEPDTSRQVLSEVNAARANMRGVNARPIPRGNVFVRPDGALRIETRGRDFGVRQDGTIASFESHRQKATFRPDGHIATLDTTTGIRIRHDAHGDRYVYHERPDHLIVVSQGPRHGWVQRPIVVRNTTYVQRTYVVNDVIHTRVYRPYTYGGIVFYRYAPPVYYRPAYYEWAWRPWARPVSYRWAWASAPWYGYYGSYFTPMPWYSSATFWLADFVIAAQLQEAYAMSGSPGVTADYDAADYDATDYPAAGEAATYEETPASPITPEVREAIAEEVRRQLEEERSAAEGGDAATADPESASGDVPTVVRQPGRVFVVSTELDVVVDDEPCSLSAGDVLRLDEVPAPGELSATVRILSSKAQDCAAGGRAILSIADLQGLYDDFHAQVDAGLGQLDSTQGSGGLPPAPSGTRGTTAGPGAVASTPPSDAASMLAETQRDADAAEAELDREIASSDDEP